MIIYQGLKRLELECSKNAGLECVLEAANGLECQTRTDRPESWDFPAFFFSASPRVVLEKGFRKTTEAFEGLGGWTPTPTNQSKFTWFCSCC